MKKEDFVERNLMIHLKDESEAKMYEAEIREELLNAKPSVDIGLAGVHKDEYWDLFAKPYTEAWEKNARP